MAQDRTENLCREAKGGLETGKKRGPKENNPTDDDASLADKKKKRPECAKRQLKRGRDLKRWVPQLESQKGRSGGCRRKERRRESSGRTLAIEKREMKSVERPIQN